MAGWSWGFSEEGSHLFIKQLPASGALDYVFGWRLLFFSPVYPSSFLVINIASLIYIPVFSLSVPIL